MHKHEFHSGTEYEFQILHSSSLSFIVYQSISLMSCFFDDREMFMIWLNIWVAKKNTGKIRLIKNVLWFIYRYEHFDCWVHFAELLCRISHNANALSSSILNFEWNWMFHNESAYHISNQHNIENYIQKSSK